MVYASDKIDRWLTLVTRGFLAYIIGFYAWFGCVAYAAQQYPSNPSPKRIGTVTFVTLATLFGFYFFYLNPRIKGKESE